MIKRSPVTSLEYRRKEKGPQGGEQRNKKLIAAGRRTKKATRLSYKNRGGYSEKKRVCLFRKKGRAREFGRSALETRQGKDLA